MKKIVSRWCWRSDLSVYRGLGASDRAGFEIFLEWFENFRLRHNLEAGRDAAKLFWTEEVTGHGRVREDWQLDQWSAAMTWYLKWLKACDDVGADHRSLPERLRAAVQSAGSRRGLAPRTKLCYGAWAARFGKFAKTAAEARSVEMATRFLTSLVHDEECAHSTQKQALNGMAFFFKQVCGVEKPVFEVKLRKTGQRVPVVLSKDETGRLFEELEDRCKACCASVVASELNSRNKNSSAKPISQSLGEGSGGEFSSLEFTGRTSSPSYVGTPL